MQIVKINTQINLNLFRFLPIKNTKHSHFSRKTLQTFQQFLTKYHETFCSCNPHYWSHENLSLSLFQIATTPSWSRWTPRWAPPSPSPPPPPTLTGPRPGPRALTTTTTTTASRLQPTPAGHKSMMWPSKDCKQGEGERSSFSWFENTGCQQSLSLSLSLSLPPAPAQRNS